MNANQSAVDALIRSLSGYVLQAPDPAYDKALVIDNGRIRRQPRLVVVPRTVQDVALAIRFASENDLPFVVKGGGHSTAGYCLNIGGVVLDLSEMNEIRLDAGARTVHAQTGARWTDIYRFLQGQGTDLIPVGGGCPTVGLPGFMLGGGYSYVSRSYGMSIDNLRAVELVMADGSVRRVGRDSTSAEDRDLFWACRGGGGGNFGVAVSMEMDVHQPPTSSLLAGGLVWPLERAPEVLGLYNEWVESVPDAMACYGQLLAGVPHPADATRKLSVVRLEPVYNGDYAEGIRLIEPLLGLGPLTTQLFNLSLPDFEYESGKLTLVKGRSAYIRSGTMAPGAMTPEVVSIFQEYMGRAPSPESFVVWTLGGGKIASVAADATAFPHRDARFIFELKSIWQGEEGTEANVTWAYDFGEALAPHFTGAYVNYIDPLLQDWPTKYYGDNYERLARVKKAVDPTGFFDFQQGVGSPFRPREGRPLDLSPLNRTIL